MTNCKYITKNGRCGLKGSYAYQHGCFGEDRCRCREPMTNADRIRAMSDEELAKIINAFTAYFDECNRNLADTDCHNCELCKLCGLGKEKAIDWLQQPFEGE